MGWGVGSPTTTLEFIMSVKTKYAKSKTTDQKQPKLEQLETAFQIVAFASLKENNEDLSPESIAIESARIERCTEFYYKIQEHDLQYPEFAKKFLFENQKEIIYGDKFLNDYLDDVPEPEERQFFLEDATLAI